jgi:uncharacterized protein YjcR
MARERDPNRDKAYEIWKQHDGNITNREIAHLLSTDEKKIAVWKQRDKWNVVQQTKKEKKNVVQQNRKTTKKARSPSNKKQNRSGNPSPSYKFPNHNSLQTKHGLYSKFLHAEQIEIMEATRDMDLPDYLWFHIQLTFSSIVRMQKIMLVENEHDHLKEEIGNSWGDGSGSESYKISFAYERYESYIKAQVRAMAEFRNLAKQFLEITHEDDERRLKLEQMQLGIAKTKAEIERLKGDPEEEYEDDGFIDALDGKVSEVWGDDEA